MFGMALAPCGRVEEGVTVERAERCLVIKQRVERGKRELTSQHHQ
jgi:hypothetical protein